MDTIVVQLRIFKGARIMKGEQGEILNQNQTVKLKYDSKEWYGFIGKMYKNGWGRVHVLAAKIDEGKQEDWGKYKSVSDEQLQEINAEVQAKLKPINEKPLTQDQKEIKELKAQMAELIAKDKAPIKDNTPDVNDELEAARKEYKKLFNKEPHHMAKLKSILATIAEEKA